MHRRFNAELVEHVSVQCKSEICGGHALLSPIHSPAVGLELNYCLRESHQPLACEVMQQNTDDEERRNVKERGCPLKVSNGPFSRSE